MTVTVQMRATFSFNFSRLLSFFSFQKKGRRKSSTFPLEWYKSKNADPSYPVTCYFYLVSSPLLPYRRKSFWSFKCIHFFKLSTKKKVILKKMGGKNIRSRKKKTKRILHLSRNHVLTWIYLFLHRDLI